MIKVRLISISVCISSKDVEELGDEDNLHLYLISTAFYEQDSLEVEYLYMYICMHNKDTSSS